MAKKHSYRTVDVEKLDVDKLIPLLGAVCVLAIDVAKRKFVASLATKAGAVQQVFRFVHPKQTLALIGLIKRLRQAQVGVEVVMEPTGIYGDVVRYQCERVGSKVYMVRPKFTHDMSEVIDGVPSMHDGKAVYVITQLHTMGKSTRWEPSSEADRQLRALVDRRRFFWMLLRPSQGQMEAMLSKWWPGFDEVLDPYTTKTARALLRTFGGPHEVAKQESRARELMRKASRSKLSQEKIEATIASAKATLAEPAIEQEIELLKDVVGRVDDLSAEIQRLDKQLRPLIEGNEVMRRMAEVVGVGTTATLVALVGSPLNYESAKAFEKAFGLNLKVRASGERKGQLAITKRGSGDARQLMYLAGLRHIQSSVVARAWYEGRKCYAAGHRKKAAVAVMRKLVKALWHVARGATFDPTKLYDLRRLGLDAAETKDTKTSREAA